MIRPPHALFVMSLVAVAACRPDPYALALRMIEPGEPVELSGGRTLTVEGREGATLTGVRIEGPAETCDGTMVAEAPEARVERRGSDGGERVVVVFEDPVVVERCGELRTETTHERLTVTLDALR